MEVLPFTEDGFANALSNKFTSPRVISEKNHFSYLFKYLRSKDLNAKTILIEDEYVSKDYLLDYVSYYAFCYEKYPKFCKRVHFFSSSFTKDEFLHLIVEEKTARTQLWKYYLGFIVVKPIPVTVIGFSVLKPYEYNESLGQRNFWGLRDYKVHLCGHEHILKSLVFQEQDSVLAACATTAIWTMLSKAASEFHTLLKSPSEITADADNVASDGSRLFPNKGLNLLQLCQAILHSGLVTEIKQPDFQKFDTSGKLEYEVVTCHYLKKILHAYSPLGIPLIIIILVPSEEKMGLHAISVSGFKHKSPAPIPPQDEISFLADNIEKIYAHDDQWGPFVKIEFPDNERILTPWTENDPSHRPTLVQGVIVPVYPKVRIPYEDIETIVLGIDRIFTYFFSNKNIQDLVWDIRIDYSEKFKAEINKSSLSDEEKIKFVTKSMPRFIWIASCFIANLKVFEFSFDATDVSNGMIGRELICYLEDEMQVSINGFLRKNRIILECLFRHAEESAYYDFLIKGFKTTG